MNAMTIDFTTVVPVVAGAFGLLVASTAALIAGVTLRSNPTPPPILTVRHMTLEEEEALLKHAA